MHVVCESAVADRSPTAFEAVSLDAEDPRPLTTESRRTNSELGRIVYLGTVIAAGTVVLLSSAVETISRPPGTLWLVLAGLTAVSSGAMVRLPGFPASFSLGDTFSILSALLFGPASGALLVTLDGFIQSWRLRISKATPARLAFNVTAPALAMWTSARLFFAAVHGQPLAVQPLSMGRIIGPLAVFGASYFLFNSGLVAGAVTIGRPTSLYRSWREHFFPV